MQRYFEVKNPPLNLLSTEKVNFVKSIVIVSAEVRRQSGNRIVVRLLSPVSILYPVGVLYTNWLVHKVNMYKQSVEVHSTRHIYWNSESFALIEFRKNYSKRFAHRNCSFCKRNEQRRKADYFYCYSKEKVCHLQYLLHLLQICIVQISPFKHSRFVHFLYSELLSST